MPIKVEDVMVRNVKTVGPKETVLKATEIMNKHAIGCIIVTENGKPIGIVTERDLLKRVISNKKDPTQTKLSEIMSKPLITVKPSTSITSAAKIMIKTQIKKLPVINNQNLVGILSLTDLIRVLRTHNMTDKISLKGASNNMKKFLEAYVDPQKRRKCPMIVLGGSLINCLGTKCMWFEKDGCARHL